MLNIVKYTGRACSFFSLDKISVNCYTISLLTDVYVKIMYLLYIIF